MTTQSLKASVIAKVAEDYRRRGYDVDVEPSGPSLPEFLGEYRPDLIARGSRETVVVGVKVGTRMSVAERLRDVVEQINRQPGWRFSLVFVNPEHPDQLTEAKPAPLPLLEERAKTADDLFRADQKEAAFLLLWSAVEGTLRLLAERADLPLSSLPPSALIRDMYSAGEISRQHFEPLMRLLPIRNQLVHGLEVQESLDVKELRRIGQELLAEARGE
jgi:hypothetical protein